MLKQTILGAILAVTVQTSFADVVFTLGNNPQQGEEENILLNTGTTGSQVFGVGNQSNLQVAFASTTDTLSEPANGQARVTADSGLLNNVTVSVPGGSFGDLIFNPFNGSGTATITAVANEAGGGTMTDTFTYTLGNGENFLTIVASGGQTLASVTIDSAGGFADLRQTRISGAQLTTTPSVPDAGSSLALLGMSMGALGLINRFRGKR